MNDIISNTKITQVEKVIADYLFQSDFYQIKNWAFDIKDDKQPGNGFNDCLCVVL